MFEQISYGASIIGRCNAPWRQVVANRSAPIVLAVLFVIQFNVNPADAETMPETPTQAAIIMDGTGLADILQAQPAYTASVQAFCSRVFGVNVAKSSYFPKLSLSLSSGDKMVDKTTRADEFGGVNSPNMTAKAQMPRQCCASLSMIGGLHRAILKSAPVKPCGLICKGAKASIRFCRN